MVKLVSTTLAHNREHTIGHALASALAQVDACIVIDTGITDRTLEVAREVAGDKLVVRQWPWRNDFAAARNAALAFAGEEGADWALTLDTDEKLEFVPGFSLREELERLPEANVMYASIHDRSYMKERVLRVGAGLYWYGFTHEVIMPPPTPGQAVHCTGVQFREALKSREELRVKAERDLALLSAMVMVDEDSPRWTEYLANTLVLLERHEEAIPLFRVATKLWKGQGPAASCVYRAMQCCWETQQWALALEIVEEAQAAQPDSTDYPFYRRIAERKLALSFPG